jgi:hypothetical protein
MHIDVRIPFEKYCMVINVTHCPRRGGRAAAAAHRVRLARSCGTIIIIISVILFKIIKKEGHPTKQTHVVGVHHFKFGTTLWLSASSSSSFKIQISPDLRGNMERFYLLLYFFVGPT